MFDLPPAEIVAFYADVLPDLGYSTTDLGPVAAGGGTVDQLSFTGDDVSGTIGSHDLNGAGDAVSVRITAG